jgi:diaminopimelate epimerase
MRELPFWKFQASGNDFVIFNQLEEVYNFTSDEVRKICHRHFGIGADGLILARRSPTVDFKMVFYNPDGKEAEMCGNGIRCLARFLYDEDLIGKEEIIIETKAGVKVVVIKAKNRQVKSIKVDMGKPSFMKQLIPMSCEGDKFINCPIKVGETELKATCLSMGNPHCIIFVEDLDETPVAEWGKAVESLPMFPEGANVGFAQIDSPTQIKLKVWERGAGLTLACGTGASAALVAASTNQLTERWAKVSLPGGELEIEWADSDNVYLLGPAEPVFQGVYKLNESK